VRENLEKWLDNDSRLEKGKGRTWKELAQNVGEQIHIKNQGMKSPRAYLHTIESFENLSAWIRMKAKVALEIGK